MAVAEICCAWIEFPRLSCFDLSVMQTVR
uniref:Uncharacterized protein n=1 Tax=Arundo donax TaxID=35708 RepID=A0A0A8YSE5_ARUDO